MTVRSTQYLLRFDDLCPTMGRVQWKRFERVLEEFAVRPILAIVPDNRDPELMREPPDPDFWKKMRAWEEAGATIALHGFRHLCAARGRGLVPVCRPTEFAGAPEELQRQWIHEGLCILRARGLNPRLWVAPRHGFDRATLRALREEGIEHLSDGLARVPFVRHGVTWIPQQLWEPVERQAGLWTICLHSNTAQAAAAEKLRAFLARHADQFTSFEQVIAETQTGSLCMSERWHEAIALLRHRRALNRASRVRRAQAGRDAASSRDSDLRVSKEV